MKRCFLLFFVIFIFVFPVCVFAQSAALRDYVGLISQNYHPGVVSYFEKIKTDLGKRGGNEDAIKAIDIFLRGDTGSGFVYSDARGNLYVITNYHVVSQASTLSITFERQDGSKRKFENLRIIAADEEIDLALLAFAPGDRPVARGLAFLTRQAQEGEDVFSAGFPGLGITPIWQFGRGMVSNARVQFPKSFSDETLMGPYIQHTAQIDPGNSGGPLLVAQASAPAGYAVVGVNTLSATRRQAANFAIPIISTTQTFITNSLNPKPETYRAALDQRLAKFVEGLGANKAVYPHIAEYLSSDCVGENAEYAIEEMYEKGSASIRRAFLDKCEDGVVGAMGYAVAWTIENSIRKQGATIKADLKEVTGAGEEYTVVFTINNKDVTSKWIREYGNWRIRSFGAVAAGDPALLSKKQAQKEAAEKLRISESGIHLEAGYAYLIDKAPAALYASVEFMSGFGGGGARVYYAGSDFFSIGGFMGFRWGIPAGNLGFMPYFRIGFDYVVNDQEYEDYQLTQKRDVWGSSSQTNNDFSMAFAPQLGVKITSTYVPGLFMGLGFQYNWYPMSLFEEEGYKKAMKMALSVTAGYAF